MNSMRKLFFFQQKKMNLLINIVWEMNKIVWIVLSRFFKRKFQKGKKDNGEAIYLSAVSNWNVSSRLSTDWPTGSVQKIPQLPEWKRASKKGREQTEPIWNGEGDICYVKGNNEINEADCVKTEAWESIDSTSDLQVDRFGLRVHFAFLSLELMLQSQQHQVCVPLCQCEQVNSRGQYSLQPSEL